LGKERSRRTRKADGIWLTAIMYTRLAVVLRIVVVVVLMKTCEMKLVFNKTGVQQTIGFLNQYNQVKLG